MERRPAWDTEKAAALIGCTILVGITFVREDGNEDVQLHGVVTDVDPNEGIVVALAGLHAGKSYRLPPDTTAIHAAAPGDYRLRSTGEIVVNPDFTATWTVKASDRDS